MKKEEIEKLKTENESLRAYALDLRWMARRYADGRSSYAPSLFNRITRGLLGLGIKLNPTADGTIWARDGMGRRYDGLTDEEAAQDMHSYLMGDTPEHYFSRDKSVSHRESEGVAAATEHEIAVLDALVVRLRKALSECDA